LVSEDYSGSAVNTRTDKEFNNFLKRIISLLSLAEEDPEFSDDILRAGNHFSGLSNIIYCEAKKYVKIRIEANAYKRAKKELGIRESALINLANEIRTAETNILWSKFHGNKHDKRLFAVDHSPSCQYITDQCLNSWLKYHDKKKIANILLNMTINIILQSDDKILDLTPTPRGGKMQSKGTRIEREHAIKAKKFFVLKNQVKKSFVK
jgi:hypothetical protein